MRKIILGYNIAKAPVYFVRSGYINLSNGRLRVSGIYGYGWSAWAYSEVTRAYYFAFDAAVVGPSYYNGIRWEAFSLRWVKKGKAPGLNATFYDARPGDL